MSKYEYIVKHNGIWYEPGEEVPDNEPTKAVEKVQVTKVEEKRVVEPEKTEDVVELKKPTSKTEIMVMKKEDLLAHAKKFGISEQLNGTELKKALIKHYNL